MTILSLQAKLVVWLTLAVCISAVSAQPRFNSEPTLNNADTVSPTSVEEFKIIQVDNSEALQSALLSAIPGDVIVLMPGTYVATAKHTYNYSGAQRTAYFGGIRDGQPISGTQDKPIILQSADPKRPAILRGLDMKGLGYVLWINGENWVISDIIVEYGAKGIMMDNASDSLVKNVTIRQIGDEGLHLRSGTSRVLVDNVTVEDTGLVQPGFGEGIYVGSDRAQWDKYLPACNNNVIRNCTLRRTTAEAIDIKEGVNGTVVTGCSIYGSKISNELFADSFIDIKGNGSRIFDNTFFKENNPLVTRSIALVNRDNDIVKSSSSYNWIYNNVFNMNDENGAIVHGYKGTENYAWNNVRIPKKGEGHKSKSAVLKTRPPKDKEKEN